MPSKPAETMEEWVEEIKDWSPPVKAVALAYPAFHCWRSARDPDWHLIIAGYSYFRELDSVVLEVVHGRGTPQAGGALKHFPPGDLLPCSCGKWEPPTREDMVAMHQRKGSPLPPGLRAKPS